ncbi:MAG: class I SAM-dependent methyltransferase [Candidatus Diapherotrites archaeon]
MVLDYPENYNSKALIKMWGDFIDWKKRREGERGFLFNKLKEFKCKKVFDSSLGEGADSIYLIKNGFEVVSNDIDKLFIEKAQKNAVLEGVTLNITELDWRELEEHFKQESFDAVLCLGNSLTYLFKKADQLKTLKNFFFILRKKGVLIIDERNYQYVLDKRKEILKEGKFNYSKKYVYCGNEVHGEPIEISENKVRMQYTDERTGKKAYLIVYPFKRNELLNLLKEAGFNKIEKFSDYKKGDNPNADFRQYVCIK